MDNPYSYNPPNRPRDLHSPGFGTASLVLGIIGISTGCCAYPAIICGALAIIFGLLSKGGAMTMSDKGKIGLILGIIGLVAGILMLVFSFVYTIAMFGSFENYMKYYMDLMQQIDPTYQQNIFY